ncbi:PREDICTED: autophagy-related protein 11-like [Tarenaya hassleriana]|uniref:autophagy-related protein 11-like n=1 Tax=Tarenaya hassleriana TaxID=28532 RepID=UPI00053C5B73|nr:PREDICTED: autophagy-related protein 11-like [Tarenaya hassleriana]
MSLSSSLTDSFANDGKLLLCVAENGHSFEFECNETTPVEAVMRFVESVSGISFNDQLLLSLDMKLESQKLLSAYRLPASDREVFVFNKARLQSSSPAPPLEEVDIQEVPDPLLPASMPNHHPLDDASDPALKALPSYERLFRSHSLKGRAIFKSTFVKYETCEKLIRERKVQERAVEVATRNLDQYYRVIYQNFLEFMKRYKHQHRLHYDLLMNFARDFEKLRSGKLHPALQTDSRKCLLDFIKEDSLKKAAENCGSSHKQFESKIAQFQQMFVEVKRKVEELFACRASLSNKNLELAFKDHERFINEQRSIMQSLSKDVNTVAKLVDDCLSYPLSSLIRPHDAVSALGPMYEVHDKSHLPTMWACHNSISELLDFCKNKKNEMNSFVHSYMQKITYVTYIIKDAKLQFPVFREAMLRQDDLFADLKLVRGIGPAYRACLAEVVRRKASMKLYMGMAGQLAERLAMKRETEVRRRQEFLKARGPYVPRDVLASMGLYDTPNQCDVNIAPYDTSLLNIDIIDIDRYAPEHLAGSHSKLAPSRNSLAMSSESSFSGGHEEIAIEALHKDSYDEILEACELVDVAGTGKMEVENAKLKADLASAIARICTLCPEVEYEALDDSKLESLLKDAAEKTAEALKAKDEYEKHLLSMLKEKEMNCASYEKRIRELEERLSEEYLQGQRHSNSKDVSGLDLLHTQANEYKVETSADAETNITHIYATEPMDEVSCVSNLSDKQPYKAREGMDENMMDSSSMLNHQLDSSMVEPQQNVEKGGKYNVVTEMGVSLCSSSTSKSLPKHLDVVPSSSSVATELGLDSKFSDDIVLDLRNELIDKSHKLSEMESNRNDAMEEVSRLSRELEKSQALLNESQMNCAHLENCLHEAREEAQTHRCAADRRASEYSALRASAVKMRGLFERFRNSVCAAGGVAGFAESLRTLAQSLSNSINDNEDDGTAEFKKCIQVLADKVSFLSRHREDLLGKGQKLEAANEQLRKDFEEKKELVKTLYNKHQLGKQANKEKISFCRLEVHEIAAFVLNSTRHYEAISRTCSNYYLSPESVALFTDHHPTRPAYIVGQIVHIERQTVKLPPSTEAGSNCPEMGKTDQIGWPASDNGLGNNLISSSSSSSLSSPTTSSSNPYGLSPGCEYFIVTIAMLPDSAIHQQAS